LFYVEKTIDARTMRGLNENELSQLIPNIGMRSRFRNLLESWKADMNCSDLPADSNVSSVSLFNMFIF